MPVNTRSGDAVGYLLKTVGRYKLCTPEEELELAQFIFNNKHLLNIEDLELTERELKLKNTTKRKLDELVNRNLRLVVSIAKKYVSQAPLEDIFQEGAIGLRTGILKFDPTKGYRLSTFVYWWIRQSITRYIQNVSDTIRRPIHIQEEYRRIKKVIKQYEREHGSSPSLSYISTELEISIEKVRLILRSMRSTSSLDVNISNSPGEATLLLELLDNSHTLGGTDEKVTNPFSNLEYTALTETIEDLLENLSPRDRLIIELKYGLKDGIPRSLNSVAAFLSQMETNSMNLPVSREYVRGRINKALTQLRGSLGAHSLKELYIN